MPNIAMVADVERQIRDHPDEPAYSALPPGSLARLKYEQGSPFLDRPNAPADADPDECREFGLSAEQWAEEMRAAQRALRHDARLNLIHQGAGRV